MPLEPPADDVSRALCVRVIARLPVELAGAQRRATAPASSITVAWDGHPPQTLRCGIAVTDAVPHDVAYCIDGAADTCAGGVLWRREVPLTSRPTTTRWTTRAVGGLEVTVTDGHERDLLDAATDAVLRVRPEV